MKNIDRKMDFATQMDQSLKKKGPKQASTRASTHCLEISTQTVLIKSDASSQVEKKEFIVKSTQTVSEIKCDKEAQTLLQASDYKETQTSSKFCLDKEVQTDNIQNSPKVCL
ncbi:hypothetical protein AVEN_40784-1 [Araneus ventricosus]|uniref:Uncharacterized protein n=1 Tax=Araneus ventricosus TaxID=182803 RepID=A0A4Y2CED5_ARAVE|nr:hypothetical protein AVEN_40784-1 [Araneus ventricosus]